MYSYDAHSAWLCQFKMLYFLIGERLFFFPSSFHSCFKKKEVTGDGWKGSVQTAKSSRPTEPLQLFFFKVPPLCLPLLLSSPLRFWSVVVPFRMVFFFFWFCPVFRVWNSILRMPCHRPAPAPPDAASDPGFHSPKARASAGSSPQAPRRHTVRHLWSSHWPLYKGKRVTKIYEIKKKKTAEHSQRNQHVSF